MTTGEDMDEIDLFGTKVPNNSATVNRVFGFMIEFLSRKVTCRSFINTYFCAKMEYSSYSKRSIQSQHTNDNFMHHSIADDVEHALNNVSTKMHFCVK